ncbi:hypothetical protein [Rhizobium populisoli]|uniref:hypothetical protein n=1 Tax=Rhizobium populisoli TaxID=2859785 RepID=UPI001FE7C60C|nr:hypothetical protein [Rhizobium populisoli]
MSKANLALGDFMIAGKSTARSEASPEAIKEGEPDSMGQRDAEADAFQPSERAKDQPLLSKASAGDRDRRARDRAIAQDEVRNSLKNLKRAKQREVKFFVNVALDQATKARLKRAADENDIKMAIVMRAAIDFYLKENGY